MTTIDIAATLAIDYARLTSVAHASIEMAVDTTERPSTETVADTIDSFAAKDTQDSPA